MVRAIMIMQMIVFKIVQVIGVVQQSRMNVAFVMVITIVLGVPTLLQSTMIPLLQLTMEHVFMMI